MADPKFANEERKFHRKSKTWGGPGGTISRTNSSSRLLKLQQFVHIRLFLGLRFFFRIFILVIELLELTTILGDISANDLIMNHYNLHYFSTQPQRLIPLFPPFWLLDYVLPNLTFDDFFSHLFGGPLSHNPALTQLQISAKIFSKISKYLRFILAILVKALSWKSLVNFWQKTH